MAEQQGEVRQEEQVERRPGKSAEATLMGATIGFGIGVIFALGGFWAGILCLVLAVIGGLVGWILASSS